MSLTRREKKAIENLGEIANEIHSVIYTKGFQEDAAHNDWAEAAGAIHVLQRMIGAQSAAREYPSKYRLLGRKVSN